MYILFVLLHYITEKSRNKTPFFRYTRQSLKNLPVPDVWFKLHKPTLYYEILATIAPVMASWKQAYKYKLFFFLAQRCGVQSLSG